jgi:hypothetical protein
MFIINFKRLRKFVSSKGINKKSSSWQGKIKNWLVFDQIIKLSVADFFVKIVGLGVFKTKVCLPHILVYSCFSSVYLISLNNCGSIKSVRDYKRNISPCMMVVNQADNVFFASVRVCFSFIFHNHLVVLILN